MRGERPRTAVAVEGEIDGSASAAGW